VNVVPRNEGLEGIVESVNQRRYQRIPERHLSLHGVQHLAERQRG
jgi:hypothetical protein